MAPSAPATVVMRRCKCQWTTLLLQTLQPLLRGAQRAGLPLVASHQQRQLAHQHPGVLWRLQTAQLAQRRGHHGHPHDCHRARAARPVWQPPPTAYRTLLAHAVRCGTRQPDTERFVGSCTRRGGATCCHGCEGAASVVHRAHGRRAAAYAGALFPRAGICVRISHSHSHKPVPQPLQTSRVMQPQPVVATTPSSHALN